MSETVLYVQPHLTRPGGSSRFVLESARALAAEGYRCVVLAQAGTESVVGKYRDAVELRFVGGPLPDRVPHWAMLPRLLAAGEGCGTRP